jgi:hypothetical protein
MQVSSRGGNSASVTASWDEHDVDGVGPTNQLYDDSLYSCLGKTTKLSLRRVDEERINYELILDILTLIDSGRFDSPSAQERGADDGGAHGVGEREGAVLVFLPGLGEIMQVCQC